MLQVSKIPRVFKFEVNNEKITLKDPNPNLSPDEVMMFFASQYPELTNATVTGPKMDNDTAVYEFKTTVGTKG